jgi:hypothetical protein
MDNFLVIYSITTNIDIVKVHSCFYIDCEKLQARFDKQSYKNSLSIMSKTLQELTAHFPAKWDEITIRATKDQFIIKKCDEIVHDGESFIKREDDSKIF